MAKIFKGKKMIVESDGELIENYNISHEIAKREKREEQFKEEKPKEVQTCLPLNRTTNHRLVHLTLTNEKRLFIQLLSELADIFKEENTSTGGRPKARLSDLIFSLGLKLYTGNSGRVLMSDLNMFEKLGFITRAHGANTINDFLNCEGTKDLLLRLLHVTAMPLKFIDGEMLAMDASGFGNYQYERWVKVRFKKGKDGKLQKHLWKDYIKAHVVAGTRTHAIYSCEVTVGTASDDKQVPDILGQLFYNSTPKMIAGDKAYSSYRTLQIINKLGATPVIPFKKNANPQKCSPDIWKLSYNYFKNHRDDFDFHYRQRPQVEATFSIVKRKFGEFLKSKRFISQSNELLMKFICHNIARLIAQIFESELHIDFKKTMEEYANLKIQQRQRFEEIKKTPRRLDEANFSGDDDFT